MLGILVSLAIITFHLVPWYVARRRNCRCQNAILFLGLATGIVISSFWAGLSLLVWIGAMCWVLSSDTVPQDDDVKVLVNRAKQQPVLKVGPQHVPRSRRAAYPH